jgi:uncharacterized protein YjbI with pentapeptide repeats
MFNTDEYDFFAENYENLDLSSSSIVKKEFDDCTFNRCNFTQTHFKSCKFEHTHFINCNLSLMQITNSRFSDVTFSDCKIIGVDWTKADWDFLLYMPMKFNRCVLNNSSFFALTLKRLSIEECEVVDVDFTDGVFKEANFKLSDFKKSIFRNCDLTDTNFSDSINFDIDISINKIHGATFSRYEALNLLKGLKIKLV